MASKLLRRGFNVSTGSTCTPRLPRNLLALSSSRFFSGSNSQPIRATADSSLPPPGPPTTPIDPPSSSGASRYGSKSISESIRSSVKDPELAKFASIAETWWDSEGPFKPLHLMNPTRLAFIRSTLCRHFRKDPYCARPFEGLKIIDVGCGGGILSEPLARMGAVVTGIDAVDKNIKIACVHARNLLRRRGNLML